MKLFKKNKTDKELQDELKALCHRVIADGYATVDRMDRYESLLLSLYERNLTPEIKLK